MGKKQDESVAQIEPQIDEPGTTVIDAYLAPNGNLYFIDNRGISCRYPNGKLFVLYDRAANNGLVFPTKIIGLKSNDLYILDDGQVKILNNFQVQTHAIHG